MRVAVGGIDVKVGSGSAVSVGETTVTAGAHEVKMRAMNKVVVMFLTFIDTFFSAMNCPTGCYAQCIPKNNKEVVLSSKIA